MSERTLHATYASASRSAGAQAAALRLLLARTAADPDLALALTQIDTTEMKGPLDTAGLRAALTEAEAERDVNAALAERYQRRALAGVALGTACVCGHSPATHAPRLTEDGRLPCRHDDCSCGDLNFF
ncbi:hypothetical protein [Streptomyces mutabilis]|uniref:hypothetical protein n=1 Tax=Streptomyces mutabilis TaxID=67332 RepID=UPI0006932290|nr:hypothetical protein [Streptomyces mutabilis]